MMSAIAVALFLISAVLLLGFVIIGTQLIGIHDSLKVWIKFDATHRNLLAKRNKGA